MATTTRTGPVFISASGRLRLPRRTPHGDGPTGAGPTHHRLRSSAPDRSSGQRARQHDEIDGLALG